MWNDVTAKEVLNKYERNPYQPNNPINSLTVKERAHVRAEVEGVSPVRYGFKKDPRVMGRPKVVHALEIILEQSGLSDRKLAKRMKEIIFEGEGANADNTAHNAIRTIWQIKGKFAPEKHEVLHRSDLEQLSDEQLNRIIESGVKEFKILQVKLGQSAT